MAPKKTFHPVGQFRATYVLPDVAEDGTVRCECGSPMHLVNYVSFPDGHRWIFYMCDFHPEHITAALPKGTR